MKKYSLIKLMLLLPLIMFVSACNNQNQLDSLTNKQYAKLMLNASMYAGKHIQEYKLFMLTGNQPSMLYYNCMAPDLYYPHDECNNIFDLMKTYINKEKHYNNVTVLQIDDYNKFRKIACEYAELTGSDLICQFPPWYKVILSYLGLG